MDERYPQTLRSYLLLYRIGPMADDKAFTGSIPKIYETPPVPLLFEDYAAGGFTGRPQIETLAQRSRAKVASDPAVGYCHGSPLRGEIEARGSRFVLLRHDDRPRPPFRAYACATSL